MQRIRSSITSGSSSSSNEITQFQAVCSTIARKASVALKSSMTTSNDTDSRRKNSTTSSETHCRCLFPRVLCHKLKIASHYPRVILSMFLLFTVILVTGVTIVITFANDLKQVTQQSLVNEASEEMAYLIDYELYKASLPLFTLAEEAKQETSFDILPYLTADAPFIYRNASDSNGNQVTRIFRDVTDICDRQNKNLSHIQKYNQLASSIMQNLNLSTIVSIELQPSGVVCLVYPDETSGDETNGTSVFGLDVINDPLSSYYTDLALKNDYPTIQGPLKLLQDKSQNHDSLALIIRDPVYFSQQSNQDIKNFWGFSTIILNWTKIETDLNIHEYFSLAKMDFCLVRPLNGMEMQQKSSKDFIVITGNGCDNIQEQNTVSVPILSYRSGWELIVAVPQFYTTPHWVYWVPICTFFAAIVAAIELMFIMVNKIEHEKLLFRMMPRTILNRLKNGGENTIIEKYDNATICFLDIVSFTTMSGQMSASEVTDMLKLLFVEFDKIADKCQVFNVETIGDAYIVIAGGPEGSNVDAIEGAQKVASFALEVVEASQNLPLFQNKWQVSIRAGLASGIVVGGVIGSDNLVPKYTLFGDTVSLSEAMEAGSSPNRVLCSPSTYKLLKRCPTHNFIMSARDHTSAKLYCNNKLISKTYWINDSTEKAHAQISTTIPFEIPEKNNVAFDSISRGSECCSDISDDDDDENYTSSIIQNYNENNEQNDNVIYEKLKRQKDNNKKDNNKKNNKENNKGATTENALVNTLDQTRTSLVSQIDDNSIESKDSNAFMDYWEGIGKSNNAWKDQPSEVLSLLTLSNKPLMSFLTRKYKSLHRFCYIVYKYKILLLTSIFLFFILCLVGISTVLLFAQQHEENMRLDAIDKAQKADGFLESEIRKSLLPLFSMSQLVRDLDFVFEDLPFLIDNRTFLDDENRKHYRNISGICDNPELLTPFYEMASSIKESAELEKILINVQLAPSGVLCLTYPLNNTEDFENGEYLDTSGAIGLDLFANPLRSGVSKAAVKEGRYTVQGPIPLIQGSASVVDEAVIARFPIESGSHYQMIDDVIYDFWGFSIVLMDWDKLKQKIGIFEFFSNDNMEFLMTRTDTVVVNSTTNEVITKVSIIAESENSAILASENSVSIPMDTTDNNWVLTVGYETGFSPAWKLWGCVAVVLGALLICSLLLVVLVTSKQQQLLLYRMIPERVIKRLQKGESVVDRHAGATIFFSHILGYTTLSQQMGPVEFLKILNQIYGAFDKLTTKHNVTKVETIGARYIVFAPGGKNSSQKQDKEDAGRVVAFATDAVNFVKNYRYKDIRFFIRAGIASGPIVSGVIGAARPKYTIFGDTVNFASRMETSSKSMKIQCNESTYTLLSDCGVISNLKLELIKRIENDKHGLFIKGKGLQYTWWITDKSSISAANVKDDEDDHSKEIESAKHD